MYILLLVETSPRGSEFKQSVTTVRTVLCELVGLGEKSTVGNCLQSGERTANDLFGCVYHSVYCSFGLLQSVQCITRSQRTQGWFPWINGGRAPAASHGGGSIQEF